MFRGLLNDSVTIGANLKKIQGQKSYKKEVEIQVIRNSVKIVPSLWQFKY